MRYARTMITTLAIRTAALAALAGCAGAPRQVAANPAATRVPGGCVTPVAGHESQPGCYLSTVAPLGVLGDAPVYWHVYAYPTRAAAEAVTGPHATVVSALGRVFLYAIAGEGWQPAAGERVAVIGPLPHAPGTAYTARYMESTLTPDMRSMTHRHSGAEAWYLVGGAQCLETSSGVKLAHAGESAIVPEGTAMSLRGVGTEPRRALVLVMHDSAQPWMTPADDWTPAGLCPR
jgi:quercetin dioxygenase-like cupin family protein